MAALWDDQTEWLETDGLGGFATGTIGGIRTRRYHGLLLAATRPPAGRAMLVNGLEAFVTTAAGRVPLSSQRYEGHVIHPEGFRAIEAFTTEPWPTWRYRLPDGMVIEQQLCMKQGSPVVSISWRILDGAARDAMLEVRPLLSGRDYHALQRENGAFCFDAAVEEGSVTWRPYSSHPPVVAHSNGSYRHEPVWYRNFLYQEEWLRGFSANEDLGSPGTISFDLLKGEAVLVFETGPAASATAADATALSKAIRAAEARRRQAFASPLHRAADQYIVRRGSGKSIIAGYPWFADWGRDSFISIRGLCMATGRLADARDILLAWAGFISEGMLPNRFPDVGDDPEYNSVDASLWYVIAVHEFLRAARSGPALLAEADRRSLHAAIGAILSGYSRGTRYGIRADRDGLLAAGAPGVQLTWMDARVRGNCITRRCGKAVEVQALWLNSLWLAGATDPQWHELYEAGRATFAKRFWNEADGALYDVIDCDHQLKRDDPSFRPNQIFAVGGLPLVLLNPARARSVVDQVERRLVTPMGLRSLAPGEAGYIGQYAGSPDQRDAAYHRGTVWPWLLGPFVEAWCRVRGSSEHAKAEAWRRFVAPLVQHVSTAGLGHVCEIADGDPPHMPRGCPFQAWSVGELLRLEQVVLANDSAEPQNSRESEDGVLAGVR